MMSRAIVLIFLAAVLAALPLAASGCAPMRTYPPVEGAREFPWPGAEPIPTMARRAIRYERLRTSDDGPLYVNLPPDTPVVVYDKLFALLRDAEPMLQEDDPTYHIIQVRARGIQGEVDLVYSHPDQEPRFVTLSMKRDFMDWRVEDRRVWRIDVDVPAPNYPDTMEDDEQGEDAGEDETVDSDANESDEPAAPGDEGGDA